uniref:11S globulin isoform 1 n=1 Tax=Cocos nucifera TaxID=13894 RepID=UPI000720204C|nr:11S globulin isoform 1 [Cocos nucifera]5XTY_A Chain A, 11S globulin isoform 1 [Cocos nucifera]5XTY_B Chain B, 11S globulin isoform 1 [Cocos nucifera]
MASSSLLSFSLCLLLLCHLSQAQFGSSQESPFQSPRRSVSSRNECRIERLNALEPTRTVRSEAGVTDYFDEDNEQFRCAGVSTIRRVIEPRGLLLPSMSNAPRLVYIVQGRGIVGLVMPGCPETFQSFQRSEREEGERHRWSRDEHQKVYQFQEGDVLAVPNGFAYWCYNNGENPVVAITVLDTSNDANQLDRSHRQFLLAGRQEQGRQRYGREGSIKENILRGFSTELLAAAFGVNMELARKLQCRDDTRGEIVRAENGLQVLRPSGMEEEEREEGRSINGFEETYCSMKIKQNIGDPRRADVFNPRGGRITTLNSEKLPILRFIQMSAERVVLYRNAMVSPHWNINAHSIMYCTGGRGRVEVADDRGETVFDGELRQGQLLIVPQNFAMLERAGSAGFQLVSIKTSDRAMVSTVVGKTSALRGMPVEVLMNSYRLSRDEARRVKLTRGDEVAIFTPRRESRAEA